MESSDVHDNMSLRVASFSCYLDTAKESLVRRVSSQDHTKPPISIKFSKKDNLRVDSFNSYLNTAPDHTNFVFEVPGPVQDPTSAFTFSHDTPKDGEIGVFGADKYFNCKLEYQTGAKTIKPATATNLARAPSLSSEASSWNSQTTLLQQPNIRRNDSQMKQKKAMARRLFMGFGCRGGGPCFDKKSVHIDDDKQPSRTGSQRIDHNLALATPPPPKLEAVVDLDESRRSIEVFGSHNRSSKEDIVAANMERKLSMLTWDAIPKGRNLPTSTIGSSTIICDDMASDASSDLFEIENISGSIYPLLTSESAAADHDASSCCMSPTTSLYAPSEASIQWSVITASAADYSALSEFNDESVSVSGDAVSKKIVAARGKDQAQNSKSTRPAGIFLGCKSQKAVDVAENVCVKSNEKPKINQLLL